MRIAIWLRGSPDLKDACGQDHARAEAEQEHQHAAHSTRVRVTSDGALALGRHGGAAREEHFCRGPPRLLS